MKVKYIGEISDPMELINGKIYECLALVKRIRLQGHR